MAHCPCFRNDCTVHNSSICRRALGLAVSRGRRLEELLRRGCLPRGEICHCGFFCSGYAAHTHSMVREYVRKGIICSRKGRKLSFQSVIRRCAGKRG